VVAQSGTAAERRSSAGPSRPDDNYDPAVVSAFIHGYRYAGGEFAFQGPDDLALAASGLLWWTEQTVRRDPGATNKCRASAPVVFVNAVWPIQGIEITLLTEALVSALERVPDRLAEQAALLADCA